ADPGDQQRFGQRDVECRQPLVQRPVEQVRTVQVQAVAVPLDHPVAVVAGGNFPGGSPGGGLLERARSPGRVGDDGLPVQDYPVNSQPPDVGDNPGKAVSDVLQAAGEDLHHVLVAVDLDPDAVQLSVHGDPGAVAHPVQRGTNVRGGCGEHRADRPTDDELELSQAVQ